MSNAPQAVRRLAVKPSKEAKTLLDAAYVRIACIRPYYEGILYFLRPVWVTDEVMPTMAVDDEGRIFFNENFVLEVGESDIEMLAGVLMHEINHVLRDHTARALGPLHTRNIWNCAADIEINQDLLADELKLPADALLHDAFSLPEKEIAETYYNMLMDKAHQKTGLSSADGESNGDSRDSNANGRGISEDSNQPDDGNGSSEENSDDSENSDAGSVCSGNCGSGATGGDTSPKLAEAAKQAGVEGRDQNRLEVAVQAAAEAIRNYMEAHNNDPGSVPAGLQRWVENLNKPVVDWRQMLRTAVLRATQLAPGVGSHTYRRPSRRHPIDSSNNVVFPRSVTLRPRVGIVIDTSGSMREENLNAALTEVQGILRAVACQDVSVFACDTQSYGAQKIIAADHVVLTGGGGTDMGEGIYAALEASPPAEVIIVLTDGDTPWPKDRPSVPVVVALVDGERSYVPEWVQTVVVDVDKRAA